MLILSPLSTVAYGNTLLAENLSQSTLSEAVSILNHDDPLLADEPVIDTGEAYIEYLIHQKQWRVLSDYLINYRNQATHDPILADFAQALCYRQQGKPQKAVEIYSAILQQNPELTYVRLSYANALFENKSYVSAKEEFAKIDLEQLLAPTKIQTEDYIKAIDNLEKLRFGVGLNYEDNKNINGAAGSRTINIMGREFVKNDDILPKSDQGIRYSASANKDYYIADNHVVTLGTFIDGIHYLHESDYNEQSLSLTAGYRYENARHELALTPFTTYNYYNSDLYNKSIGIKSSYAYRFAPQWRGRLSHTAEQIDYNKHNGFDGLRYNYQGSLLHYRDKYTLFGNLNYGKENTDDDQYRTTKVGGGIGLEYRPAVHLGLQLRYNFSKREFEKVHPLFGVARRDTEQLYHIALFDPQLSYKGWTPTLNYSYRTIDSNIADLYSTHSKNLYLSIYNKF